MMLQHGAFKKIFPYRPRILMQQLMQRITKTSAHRRFHIHQLNKIGWKISQLHEHFLRFQNTQQSQSGKMNPDEVTQAVTEIIEKCARLAKCQAELDLLKERTPPSSCDSWRRFRIRMKYANSVYWADMVMQPAPHASQ
eukprot:SAG31_NODE_58_length_29669_cov_20.244978_6_plen_139_part_00